MQLLMDVKDKAYYYLVDKNSLIKAEYDNYVQEHLEEHAKKPYRHWWRLFRLNWHYRILRRKSGLYLQSNSNKTTAQIRFYENKTKRKSIDDMFAILSQYDIVSFDIFDTALNRKVENPMDVFTIMALEMGHNDFADIRKRAETFAREKKEKAEDTREVTLSEIYKILKSYYGIDPKWEKREIELELELSIPNPYIYEIYKRLLLAGKKIIFISDMYLPSEVISEMLHRNGYSEYLKLYVSNEYKLRKGDGKLQALVLLNYVGQKIIHVGDDENSDVKKSKAAGMNAVFNPSSRLPYREPDMDNIAGSFYRAIVNHHLNNGVWDKSIHYEHGFRVGGILAAGFCQYLNKLAREKNIDKILFCARDCEIIWQIYNQFFCEKENEYIQISRYSIMHATSERYLYDLANRYILRYIDQYKSSKTLETIFRESGFGYLTEYLEADDIDKFLFPRAISRRKLELFIFNHKHIIEAHNAPYVQAAKKYFASVIGDAKNILVVDIGWSGTCITALKYFIERHFPEKECRVSGALMCTSRGRALTTSLSDETVDAFVYSPFKNMDTTRFMMPGGAAARSARTQDLLHMPLEFLFTSVSESLLFYGEDDNGNVIFKKTNREIENKEEILEMQKGMVDFISIFQKNTQNYRKWFTISPYVAFNPLRESIKNREYCRDVYKNFTYDAFTAPFDEDKKAAVFDSLFTSENKTANSAIINKNAKRILFITPELTYTGTPRSLLRMCRVALHLGYHVTVWSAKNGPFIEEYEKSGIEVKIVPESDLEREASVKAIKKFDMAVCNTIATDRYARICSYYIPTVWYIREATNLPDFMRDNPLRDYIFRHSKNIYCVSDYAADALHKYTHNKIHVVKNCVEDETNMAVPYIPGTGDKIRFVQFGTMEYRKGYDVLLAAYQKMPKDYRDKAELYFAGGFINSGTPFCSYLFSKIENEPNVHYLGIIKGEEKKIETLSSMDVVVVASRDESCSLVALEGAMLSKPLIVTENVGAKYMVNDENGFIVKTADVDSLMDAMMHMIDKKEDLAKMGEASRHAYEQYASMESYTRDMEELYSLTQKKRSLSFAAQKYLSRFENSTYARFGEKVVKKISREMKRKHTEDVIISLTSHPGRIRTVAPCIESLIRQSVRPTRILLWLSAEQFPKREEELPKNLLKLKRNRVFDIRWVEDDLAPHKKYFYAMQEYPELPVIITDDDVIYEKKMVEKLMNSYRAFPDCISCMRANLITFKPNGELRSYDGWSMDYRILMDIPSYQLMPTGVGGVLYPPHSIPQEAFSAAAIKSTCLYADDLWLKFFAVLNGYPTVIPRDFSGYKEIAGTQDTALWRMNVHKNNNDVAAEKILSYLYQDLDKEKHLLQVIRKDRFC